MNVFISILIGIFEQGFTYAILALGIYITYKILDYPDLSVDGTFPLGSAITAVLILNDVNPWLAILIAFCAGAVAGMFTGIFHVVFKIKDLLSGIITMTGLVSINLMISGEKANLPITKKDTIFNSGVANLIPEQLSKYKTVIIVCVCALIIKFILDWYLKTKSGLLLRATGDNPVMVTLIGKNYGLVKIIGLMLCNGLAATSGSIICQQSRNFDASSGTGMMVMGLTSVIIGTSMLGKIPVIKTTSMVVFGAILYKACLAVAIYYNFSTSSLKLVMALIFLFTLIGKDMIDKGGIKNNAKITKYKQNI